MLQLEFLGGGGEVAGGRREVECDDFQGPFKVPHFENPHSYGSPLQRLAFKW